MKKRILVTGGLGFIGSHFVQMALERGYHVINVDKQTYAARKDLNFDDQERYEYINADIVTLDHLPPNIDYIVNFAAESHVDNSILANQLFFESNTRGVYNILELIRAKDPSDRPVLLHISTDEVYGDIFEGSRAEGDTLKPSNPYSATKSAAEQLIFGWGRTYGIPYKIARSSNNYGIGQYPEKLIPKTIEYALEGKKMTIHGDGSYSREWTCVTDNCEGLFVVLEHGELGEVYNISSGEMLTNLEVVTAILKELGMPEDFYEFVENRVGQDIRYSVDPSKVKALGWESKQSLQAYLPTYITWYKDRYGK